MSILNLLKDFLHWLFYTTFYAWELVNDEIRNVDGTSMVARDGPGFLWFNNKFWILGGWNTNMAEEWKKNNPNYHPDAIPLESEFILSYTTNEIWSSPDALSWTLEASHYSNTPTPDKIDPVTGVDPITGQKARWRPRHAAGWIVHEHLEKKYLYVIGGDDEDGTEFGNMYSMPGGAYPRDVWRSLDGTNWELVTQDAEPFRPEVTAPLDPGSTYGRTLHAVGSHNGKLWVFGGAINLGDGVELDAPLHPGDKETKVHPLDDLWSSDDGGKTWTRRAVNSVQRPSPRGLIYTLVSWRGDLWLCGGGTYHPYDELRTYYNDVWHYNEAKDQWFRIFMPKTDVGSDSWEAREYHNVIVFDDKLWVMSGTSGGPNGYPRGSSQGNRNDVWFSKNGVYWEQLKSDVIWEPGHADGVCVNDAGLWHAGGNGTFANHKVDVWVLRAHRTFRI